MARNAIESHFQSSKMATDNHIIKKNNNNSCLLPFCENKSCVLIWNDRKWFSVIQNGPNRTSKMAVGGHLKKKKNCCILPFCEKKKCVLIWNGEKCNRKFWLTCSHFVKRNFKKAIESDFRSSKMAAGSHYLNKIKKKLSCALIWNGDKCDRKWFLIIQNGGGI